MWVAGAFLLPSIVHNAGLRKFSRNRNCRTSVDALLILKGRLSEHVEASDVTGCLIYPVSSFSLRRVFGSADHSAADRTSDRAGAVQE
jgi:hypothetical protein